MDKIGYAKRRQTKTSWKRFSFKDTGPNAHKVKSKHPTKNPEYENTFAEIISILSPNTSNWHLRLRIIIYKALWEHMRDEHILI